MIATISLEWYSLSPIIIMGSAIIILLLLLLFFKPSGRVCALFSIISLFIALSCTIVLGVQLYRGEIRESPLHEKHLILSAPNKHQHDEKNGEKKIENEQVKQHDVYAAHVNKNRLLNNGLQSSSTMKFSQEKVKETASSNQRIEENNVSNTKRVWQAIYVTVLFTSDAYALLYTGLLLIISIVVAAFASSWFTFNNANQSLFYLILLFSVLGGIILVYSSHLISLFIGIELLSTPLIGLIGFQYTQNNSVEATVKYMVLSAVATAFLLLGIAFYYAATGELTFSGLSFQLSTQSQPSPLLLTGICLMLVGIGFKLSLVPFQLWLPDVFQGAPAATSLFLSTAGKLAVFCAVARLFLLAPIVNNESIQLIVVIMAFSSILFGNFFALMQNNIKRLVAYASITNYGYLFVALIAVQYQVLALETIGIYLVSYALANICVFGAINFESSASQIRDKEMVMDLRGLFWRKPLIATTMTIGLLSLAGLPLTIGFIGRFLLILLSVTAQLWWLTAAIVIGNVCGLYFYLRLIINLYLRNEKVEIAISSNKQICSVFHFRMLNINEIISIFAALLILFIGIYPQLLLSLVSAARYLIP